MTKNDILFLVFVVMPLLIIYALLQFNLSERNSSKHEPEKRLEKITAFELFNIYNNNEVAADDRFKGAIIEIRGTVQSIDKDFTNDISIKLETPNEYIPVILIMKKSQKSIAVGLRKWQRITARCNYVSRSLLGSPYATECAFSQLR